LDIWIHRQIDLVGSCLEVRCLDRPCVCSLATSHTDALIHSAIETWPQTSVSPVRQSNIWDRIWADARQRIESLIRQHVGHIVNGAARAGVDAHLLNHSVSGVATLDKRRFGVDSPFLQLVEVLLAGWCCGVRCLVAVREELLALAHLLDSPCRFVTHLSEVSIQVLGCHWRLCGATVTSRRPRTPQVKPRLLCRHCRALDCITTECVIDWSSGQVDIRLQ
jgi:hypothetical protein